MVNNCRLRSTLRAWFRQAFISSWRFDQLAQSECHSTDGTSEIHCDHHITRSPTLQSAAGVHAMHLTRSTGAGSKVLHHCIALKPRLASRLRCSASVDRGQVRRCATSPGASAANRCDASHPGDSMQPHASVAQRSSLEGIAPQAVASRPTCTVGHPLTTHATPPAPPPIPTAGAASHGPAAPPGPTQFHQRSTAPLPEAD